MAISKILNMKDCGGHFHGKHLKRSLDYVMNPEKTQDGRLVGAINCQVDSAFEQMKATKRKFGKVDKRQGYHIILSFKEDEVNPDMAFEITRRFVEEYTHFKGAFNAGQKAQAAALSLDQDSVWDVTEDSYVTALTDTDTSLANIHSNGHTVYYDAANEANAWLQGQTKQLPGGGKLTPQAKPTEK